ncbi:MAG: hypothetical protein LAP40_27000 [Acidobacteriia bacterium]|nr:hypothetical protein [Terriglobia bacterium]
MSRRILKLAALLAAAVLLSGQAVSPPPEHLSPGQWREDVANFGRELAARHKDLFFHLPRAEFEQQISRLEDAAATASDIEMRAGLTRIMAAVDDPHSWILAFNQGKPFELRFRQFPEGWYCTEARDDMAEAVGARLISVAGIPVEEATRRLLPFIAQQNPIQTQDAMASLLLLPRALEAAGLPVPGKSADFELMRDGRRFHSLRAGRAGTVA